ncbi:hypothetical protein K8R78_07630 [bacterium]|nr:hypothetical protein [bacterium]
MSRIYSFLASLLVVLLLSCNPQSVESGLFTEETLSPETEEQPLFAQERVVPQPLAWEIEPLRSHGGMSEAMLVGIERLLVEHTEDLMALYSARLRVNPTLCGKIIAHVTTESGVLLFLSLEKNTTGDEALATQLLGQMYKWNWPSSGRDLFRLHIYLRRRVVGERGLVNAGGHRLRPLPEPPPVFLEPEAGAEEGLENNLEAGQPVNPSVNLGVEMAAEGDYSGVGI